MTNIEEVKAFVKQYDLALTMTREFFELSETVYAKAQIEGYCNGVEFSFSVNGNEMEQCVSKAYRIAKAMIYEASENEPTP